jgi:hypothetical protein
VWVLVGSLGCVGCGMCCVGGIHGVGVLVLLLRSWRVAYPDLLWFHLSYVRGVVSGSSMDGGLYSGESFGRCR